MRPPRTLAVVSHVVHYIHDGRLHAYGPYALEIEQWAELFDEIRIAAPVREGPPPGDAAAFRHDNIRVAPQRESGGTTVPAKVKQLLMVPALVWSLARVLRKADAIMVRCPGNLGLLGAALAPILSPRTVAKYAGQWTGYPGESWTVSLQRWLLRSRLWRGPVLVYGKRPDDPEHVVPFFSSALTDEQLQAARAVALAREPRVLSRVIFVGRLGPGKNVGVLLEALSLLGRKGVAFEGLIVGDGPDRAALEAQARDSGLEGRVRFFGGLPLPRVFEQYASADILVLASESEGWPKAIIEGMAFGLVCVGSSRGLMPEILGEERGFVVPPGDAAALAGVLEGIIADSAKLSGMMERASVWASRYSLEEFRASVRRLLTERWGVPVGKSAGGDAPVPVMHLIDTLDPGGAERVAVNLANSLPRERFTPHLCTTRRDGLLESEVAPDVGRLRLARKSALDPGALLRLSAYARANGIEILHPHGSSIFIAAAASLLPPYPRVIWHDHYGGQATRQRSTLIYWLAARRLDGIAAVSSQLVDWARHRLGMSATRVRHIPNFVRWPREQSAAGPELPGRAGKRIVCVANFRPQKDHVNLLKAMEQVVREEPDAHLLLVGAPVFADQVELVRNTMAALHLESNVTVVGESDRVSDILRACDIGVLSSASEAFPLVLLEYGAAGLPAVATDVGQCADALDHGRAGILVPPGEPRPLADALIGLLRDSELRSKLGAAIREHIQHNYSEAAIVKQISSFYDEILLQNGVPATPAGRG